MSEAYNMREQRVRDGAYALWENEGRPYGRDAEHWRLSEQAALCEIEPAAVVETEPTALSEVELAALAAIEPTAPAKKSTKAKIARKKAAAPNRTDAVAQMPASF